MTDRKTFSWLLSKSGKYKINMCILLVMHIVLSLGAVSYAIVMKKMIDSAVSHDSKGFYKWLIIFALLILHQIVLRLILRFVEEVTRCGIENTFKLDLFKQLQIKDYRQVNDVHSQEWMNTITSDTVVCANSLTEIIPGFCGMAVRMAGAMILIFLLQPKLAYIMIPAGIVFVIITLVLRKYLKICHKKVQEKDGALRVYLQERISSMLIIRIFGAQRLVIDGAKYEMEEHKKARMKKLHISNICNTGFSAAINGMYLLGIGYCGYGILNGVVTYGTLTAIMQLVGQLQAPLSGISGYVPRFYAMIASGHRLMIAQEYKDADSEMFNDLQEVVKVYNEKISKIVVENVDFSYTKDDGEKTVIDNFNLTVDKGDYVAITGASGCGKSTILKLLMGIYTPDSGNIYMKLNDAAKINTSCVKRMFAYVPQGNYLMGGTIREIIEFARDYNSEANVDSKRNTDNNVNASIYTVPTIEQAIELSCSQFIYELTDGLDTILGEKGAGLSEGQMQRIAIARALYSGAPVLILDEATSALDEKTEEKILMNLKNLTNKTVLIVTHRMKAIEICNKHYEL